jgi:mannose/cellobiose epimerase-like protein (N-acyl-D-glucosamine 2-epimerase family)
MIIDDYRTHLKAASARLHQWLETQAYPRWMVQGVEPVSGRFVETIERDGSIQPQPLRIRVQARQIFVLSQALDSGWRCEDPGLLMRALDFMKAHYQRRDGLFRTLIGADSGVLDDRALLYDQAFVLLSYAAAARALHAREEFEMQAVALRTLIDGLLRAPDGAFFSDLTRADARESNPHMHLLEACLAWADIGVDARWRGWAEDLTELALSRFIRGDSGVIGESYTAGGFPSPGIAGRVIEPGHQFEWAWLLLRGETRLDPRAHEPALRLIDMAEQFGTVQGFAVNALLDDFSLHDANARLWPQTERLKAALSAAESTGAPRYWSMACDAADSLFAYLNQQTPGLWFDVRTAQGQVTPASAPASTLYHLVGAIATLRQVIGTDP